MKRKNLLFKITSLLLVLILLAGVMVSCKPGEQGVPGEPGVQGEKGEDGKTPSFKVEENVIYVSYDDGKTWSSLGNIGGANGKDGKDGANGMDGSNGLSIQGVETDEQGRLVFVLSDGTKLPPVEIPKIEADSENAAILQEAREAYIQHLLHNNGSRENTEHMVFDADGKLVALHSGTVVGVYASQAAALKALLDDSSTDKDESALYTLTGASAEGLYFAAIKDKVVDLVMFMGQSNMAGRGVTADAPTVGEGHGYEFRAVSDPTKLYPITEPFGANENHGVVKESSKTGSMVSAFVNAYYEARKVPIVAVSCSKGGTGTDFWAPNGDALNEAIARHNAAKEWLEDNGYIIARDFMVWCQGETDANDGITADAYSANLTAIIEEMITESDVEFCAVVRIGNKKDAPTQFDKVIFAQTNLCKTYGKAVLVSTRLAAFAAEGKMKDAYHYTQEGYNIVGADAGANTAYYVNTGKEPSMYDPEYDNTYPTDEIPALGGGAVSSLEFNFNSATENGVDLSAIGTVENGVLKVDSTKNESANGIALPGTITISPDESFTIEFIIDSTKGGIVLASGSNKGEFLYCTGEKVRLRFASSSKQFEAAISAAGDTMHIAVVYDATAKTLSMYQDGTRLSVSGNMDNFGTITFNTLCGGYNASTTYYFQGEMHYFRYVNEALDVNEFHQE